MASTHPNLAGGAGEEPALIDSSQGFYYLNPPLRQRISLIQHLLEYANQSILVSAGRGMGKTSMLKQLNGYAGDHWKTCVVQGDAALDVSGLLQRFVAEFGLPRAMRSKESVEVLRAIRDSLAGLRDEQRVVVVLVDDAHELSADALSLLLEMARPDGRRGTIRLVLFSEPHINDILKNPSMVQFVGGFMHRLVLPEFSERQTREYLVQRSAQAGRDGPLPLSAAEVRRIYQYSRGIPGQINALVTEALGDENAGDVWQRSLSADGAARPSMDADGRKQKTLIIAGIALGLVVVALIWLLRTGPENTETRAQADLEIPPEIPSLSTTEPESPALPEAMQSAAQDASLPEPSAAIEAQLALEDVEETLTEGIDEVAGEQPEPTTQISATQGRDQIWLIAQPDEQYVVQLLSSRDKPAVMAFVAKHQSRLDLAWFKTHIEGQVWYVVVEGLYADRDRAQERLVELSRLPHVAGPLSRSIASVKRSIGAAP